MSTQSQRALLLSHGVAEFERRVNALLDYAEIHPQATFAEPEAQVRQRSRDCFAPLLEGLPEWRSQELEGFPRCQCGAEVRHKGQQQRSQETSLGRITWRRGCCHCESCRRGSYPLDEAPAIGPGRFSDGLQRGLCRPRAGLPFAPAAESFTALTGVSVSPREAQRLTEGRGGVPEARQEREGDLGLAGQWEAEGGAAPPGAGAWAAALDAARVRFEDGWHDVHDVKAGVVFGAEPRWDEPGMAGGEATAQSCVAETGPVEQAGARLYREADRRGIGPAEDRVVCLGDGAAANWNRFGLHFPRRVEVLDWYHAVEHPWAGAKEHWGEEIA